MITKLKSKVIYILTFMFLFTCINIKITYAEDTTEKIEITHVFNRDLFVKGLLIAINNIDTLNKELSYREFFMQNMGGYNDNGDEAVLVIESFDTSSIDVTKEGIYYITVKLGIHEDFYEDFFISEDTATLTIPVCISDPNYYDIFLRGISLGSLDISYLRSAETNGEILFIQSPTEISYKELTEKAWDIYNTIAQSNTFFRIDRSFIELNTHYYFRLKIGDDYSNILHVIDDGTLLHNDYTGGDRDGGDTGGNELPDQVQPPPKPPALNEGDDTKPPMEEDDIVTPPSDENNIIKPPTSVEDAPPPSNNDTNKPPNPNSSSNTNENNIYITANRNNNLTLENEESSLEIFSNDKDIISGYRLKLMFEINNGKASFSKHDITVTLPQSFLDDLNLLDDDNFCIEIKKLSDSEFTLFIAINNKEFIDISEMTFMVPYTKGSSESQLSILNGSTYELNINNYDEAQNIVYFTSNKTGNFKIIETLDNKELTTSNNETKNHTIVLYLITAVVISCVALILFLKYKKVNN